MILCSETIIMWNENMCNYNEIMRPGFERMTSGVTSMISLKFCTKCFENVHLAYENSTKPIKKNCKQSSHKPIITNVIFSYLCPSASRI